MNRLDIGGVSVPGRVLAAPMTGVTDLPFRRLISRLGGAYVATEMVATTEFARGRPDVVRRAASNHSRSSHCAIFARDQGRGADVRPNLHRDLGGSNATPDQVPAGVRRSRRRLGVRRTA